MDQALPGRGGAGRDGLRGGRRQRLAPTASTDGARARRLPGLEPVRAGLRRHAARGRAATITSEVVWNEAGGRRHRRRRQRRLRPARLAGDADVPPAPTAAGRPRRPGRRRRRGPATGYWSGSTAGSALIGGTSAVAPLWAGLVALLEPEARQAGRLPQPAPLRPAGRAPSATSPSGNNGSLQGRPGLGRLHRPGQPRRCRPAGGAAGRDAVGVSEGGAVPAGAAPPCFLFGRSPGPCGGLVASTRR